MQFFTVLNNPKKKSGKTNQNQKRGSAKGNVAHGCLQD